MRHALLRVSCLMLMTFLGLATAAAEEAAQEPITPKDGVIRLFNGQDLSGLYTFLMDTKYDDPRQVFTVQDGMLHISGDGLGAVLTKQAYRNYHLICEFKWGSRTWGKRANWARDSGILFHCTGPDGDYGGVWPESIEFQMVEGGIGDIYIVRGQSDQAKVSLTCEVTEAPTPKTHDRDKAFFWTKGAPRKTFDQVCDQIQWCDHDRNWENRVGFRGIKDVESPWGQWNRLDLICDGDHVLFLVNGQTVNEGFAAHPSAGKLLIQSELAELYVRRWELWPLGKAPAFDAQALNPPAP